MINEYCKVKTLVEKCGFPINSIGIVVSIYASGKACEVEIWDDTDYPVDVITYMIDEVACID